MFQALVRTLRYSSQQILLISVRTTLQLRSYDFTGMSSFNLLYIVSRTSLFFKFKSQFEKCIQESYWKPVPADPEDHLR